MKRKHQLFFSDIPVNSQNLDNKAKADEIGIFPIMATFADVTSDSVCSCITEVVILPVPSSKQKQGWNACLHVSFLQNIKCNITWK